MPIPRSQLGPTLKGAYDYLDSIGEYVESSIASAAAVALTSTATANVTSITLTPGDWNVFGVIAYLPAASTSMTYKSGGSSIVSATIGGVASTFSLSQNAIVPGVVAQSAVFPMSRINVTANTIVYLVANATFTVSTMTAYGVLAARRVSKP